MRVIHQTLAQIIPARRWGVSWVHKASTYAVSSVAVDVTVLEVDCSAIDGRATTLAHTSRREHPNEAMGGFMVHKVFE